MFQAAQSGNFMKRMEGPLWITCAIDRPEDWCSISTKQVCSAFCSASAVSERSEALKIAMILGFRDVAQKTSEDWVKGRSGFVVRWEKECQSVWDCLLGAGCVVRSMLFLHFGGLENVWGRHHRICSTRTRVSLTLCLMCGRALAVSQLPFSPHPSQKPTSNAHSAFWKVFPVERPQACELPTFATSLVRCCLEETDFSMQKLFWKWGQWRVSMAHNMYL